MLSIVRRRQKAESAARAPASTAPAGDAELGAFIRYWQGVRAAWARSAPTVDQRNARLAEELRVSGVWAKFCMARDLVFERFHRPGGGSLFDSAFVVEGHGVREVPLTGDAPPPGGGSAGGPVVRWLGPGGVVLERHPETRSEIAERNAELDNHGRCAPPAGWQPDPMSPRWQP